MIKRLPTLYGASKSGKIKEYQISIVHDDEDPKKPCEIIVEHGYQNGKKQSDATRISEGKNIGKANETTCFSQACSEAWSMHQSAKDKLYCESLEELQANKKILPMLAHKYADHKNKIVFPCFIQPKLNGVRCLAERKGNQLILHSRSGKEYDHRLFPRLTIDLLSIMEDGMILDGELYTHGMNFQEIISAVKKKGINSPKIQYFVYDMVDTNTPFVNRIAKVASLISGKGYQTLVYVPTILINGENDFKSYHKEFTSQDYEGSILRNSHGKYLLNHRSHDLQKYKDFIDTEYKIVTIIAADTGREQGAAICICETKGTTFNVRLRGSMEYRRDLYYNKNEYIGKALTVKYQNLSEDGIPIFPVGIAIRDYE